MNTQTQPTPDAPTPITTTPPRSHRSRFRVVVIAIIGFVVATLGALLMLIVAIVTLLQTRRFYAEVIAKRLGQFALWLCGVRMVVHRDQPLPHGQTVFISNHTSTLDVFVLIALGLPNSRFFMYGKLRRILPVGLIGYLIGIFWTVDQCFTERRRKIFERAGRVLKRTRESVYLSPEGERVLTGEIGHFNKGAFHMATDLQAPIQPMYIHIPAAINRGFDLVSDAGVVDVYFLPPIETTGWQVADVESNRDSVRRVFVNFHDRMRTASGQP